MTALLHGREIDRLPFVTYEGIVGPREEVWKALGRENVGLLRWCGACRCETPHCRLETEETDIEGTRGWIDRIVTPEGSLTQRRRLVPDLGVTGFDSHYAKTPEDYRVLAAFFRDTRVVDDTAGLEAALADLAEDGLAHAALPRTPWQSLWIEYVSLEDLSVHLAEAPDAVEECLVERERIYRDALDSFCRAAQRLPLSHVVIPDNITAPAIGPRLFDRYCLPLYRETVDRMAEYGLPVAAHLDGDLKALRASVAASGLRAVDSHSPPPDNDLSVAEALEAWPEMRLWVNFPSSVHLAAPEAIYEAAREIARQDGGRGQTWIQISENVPPGRWITSFPPIVRALADHGRPR